MRAGLLTETITFLTPTIIKNEFGASEATYTPTITTKARITYKSGSFVTENQEMIHDYVLEIIVRKYHQLSTNMLILYKNIKYRIISIDTTIRDQQKIICDLYNE